MPGRTDTEDIKNDFDGFWKDACDALLKEFLQLAAPDIHDLIDWREPYTALDTELHAVLPSSRRAGKRFVDRLYQVVLKTGKTVRLFLHIEIQMGKPANIARRMFDYNYILEHKLRQPVYSIVVLEKAPRAGVPLVYKREFFGMKHRFEIPTVCLKDFRDRIEDLKRSDNPFALLLVAWFWTRDTSPNRRRLQLKIEVARLVRDRGYSRKRVDQMFVLLDWIMRLPEPLILEFKQEADRLEGETNMPIISPTGELYRKEGLQEGLQKGILQGHRVAIERFLTARFGTLPAGLPERLAAIENDAILKDLVERAALTNTVDQFMAGLSELSAE